MSTMVCMLDNMYAVATMILKHASMHTSICPCALEVPDMLNAEAETETQTCMGIFREDPWKPCSTRLVLTARVSSKITRMRTLPFLKVWYSVVSSSKEDCTIFLMTVLEV